MKKKKKKKRWGFASVELDENQSLCTREHTSVYFCCIQTDTGSKNSRTNRHSLILSPSSLPPSVSLAPSPALRGQTWALSPAKIQFAV